jgi:NADH:ubiquinone oxidoreductase subunit 6 (subunit J)
VLGAGVTGLLLAVLLPVAGPARERPGTTSTAVAEELFGTWVWPFEVLSLLLLVALIAAFAVSRMAGGPSAAAGGPGERTASADPGEVQR